MDPVSALTILVGVSTSYAATLLAKWAEGQDKADVLRSVQRLAEQKLKPLAESMSRDDVQFLADELQKACPLITTALVVDNHLQVPRIAAVLKENTGAGPRVRERGLEMQYDQALSAVIEAALEAIDAQPETGVRKWRELFRLVDGDQTGAYATFEADYRHYIAEEYARIRLVGVQVPETVHLDLDTAFVELGMARLTARELPEGGDKAEYRKLPRALRDLEAEPGLRAKPEKLGEVVAQHRRLVIVGAPGSGKTTLMQHLARRAALRQLAQMDARLTEDLLPFPFRVRSLDFEALPAPEQFVEHCCSPHLGGRCPKGFVDERLRSGRAVILIDGLDECDTAQNEKLMGWIEEMTKAHHGCAFVLTSRPAGYRTGILRPHKYVEAELQPLNEGQRPAFINGWYRAAEQVTGARNWEQEAERGATDLLGRLDRTPSMAALATNPLMLAVICVVHRYRHEGLPERRAQLLTECVNVLLHEWHKSRKLPVSLFTELDASQKAALVRPLAWKMMEEGIAETSGDTAETIFRQVLPELGQPRDRAEREAAQLVDLIRDQSGLLLEQRPGVFSFAHLIFQYYLAAEHAENTGEWNEVLRHAGDEEWQEVIPLAAGLSKKACETLVHALLQKGQVEVAGRCVAVAVQLDPALREEVVDKLVAQLETPWSHDSDVLVEIGGPLVVGACLRRLLALRVEALALLSSYVGLGARPGGRKFHISMVAQTMGAWTATAAHAWDAATIWADAARAASVDAPVEDAAATTWDADAWDAAAAWDVMDAAALAGVMTSIGVGPILDEIRQALAGDKATHEQKLFLWSPLAEVLEPSDADWAIDNLQRLPGDVFPLLRLCVLHRLRHRWGEALREDKQRRLAALILQAERDLEAFFVRFAELVRGEKQKLKAGKERKR